MDATFVLDLDGRRGLTDATVADEEDGGWLVAAEQAVVEGVWRALGWALTHVDQVSADRLARWPAPSRHRPISPGTAGALWKRVTRGDVELVPDPCEEPLREVARTCGVGAVRRGAAAPALGPHGDLADPLALAFAIGCAANRGAWARDGRFLGLDPPPAEAPDWSDLSDLERLATSLAASNGCSVDENLENLVEALSMTLPKYQVERWDDLGPRQRAAVAKAVQRLLRDAGL